MSNPSGADHSPPPPPAFAVGELVTVESRTWPGINKPGGVGKVSRVHTTDDDSGYVIKVDVRYVLGGDEKEIELQYVKKHEDLERGGRSRQRREVMNVSGSVVGGGGAGGGRARRSTGSAGAAAGDASDSAATAVQSGRKRAKSQKSDGASSAKKKNKKRKTSDTKKAGGSSKADQQKKKGRTSTSSSSSPQSTGGQSDSSDVDSVVVTDDEGEEATAASSSRKGDAATTTTATKKKKASNKKAPATKTANKKEATTASNKVQSKKKEERTVAKVTGKDDFREEKKKKDRKSLKEVGNKMGKASTICTVKEAVPKGSTTVLQKVHAVNSRAASSFVDDVVGRGAAVVPSTSSSKKDTAVDSHQQDDASDGESVDESLSVDVGRRQLFVSSLNDVMMKRMVDEMGIDEILDKVNAALVKEEKSSASASSPSAGGPLFDVDGKGGGGACAQRKAFTNLEIRSYLNELDREQKIMVTWDSGTVYRI